MATVAFTSNLERHVECPTRAAGGTSVRAVLDAVFAANPRLRGYAAINVQRRCGTIPGGLFRSEDRGASWSLVEADPGRPRLPRPTRADPADPS